MEATKESIQWHWEQQFAAVASDTVAYEAWPSPKSWGVCMHEVRSPFKNSAYNPEGTNLNEGFSERLGYAYRRVLGSRRAKCNVRKDWSLDIHVDESTLVFTWWCR